MLLFASEGEIVLPKCRGIYRCGCSDSVWSQAENLDLCRCMVISEPGRSSKLDVPHQSRCARRSWVNEVCCRCNDLNSSAEEGSAILARMQGRPLCVSPNNYCFTAAPLDACVCTVIATCNPFALNCCLQSESAGKVKWYMGIVVEPNEEEKASYNNKRKGVPFTRNEWYLQNFSTPAIMIQYQMTQVNTISPL